MKHLLTTLSATVLLAGPANAQWDEIKPKQPSYEIQREFLEIAWENACDIGTGRISKEQSRSNMKQYVSRLADEGITLAELKYLSQMDRMPAVRKEIKKRYKAGDCG